MEPAPPAALGKKSVLWAATETGGTTALTLVAMLLMARMMGPDEFGTAALVIGGVQFLNLFVEGLFHDGLIQNPDTDDDKFEAAFSLVLIIAGAIVAVALIVALSAYRTNWDGIAWLFFATTLSLPFTGVLGIGNARMRRDMVFKEVAHASLTGRLVGSVLGLALAALGLGARSLVGQYLCIAILQSWMLYRQFDWRPRLRGSFGTLWPICRFALPYAAMHSLVALRLQGFLMMVAGFMGLTAAGFINVAFRLTTTPQVVLTTAFTNLGLPLLARHQTPGPEQERAYLQVTQLVMATTIPAFVGLALTAQDLVPILLGAAWIPVVPMVQIVALGAAVSFLRFPASSMLRALGYVRYSFASSCFQLVFTLAGLLLLHHEDMMGAVLLWVLPTLVQLPATLFVVHRVGKIRLRVVCGSLLPSLVASAAMAVVVTAVAQAMQTQPSLYRLVAEVMSGAMTAIVVLLLADSRSRTLVLVRLRKAQLSVR